MLPSQYLRIVLTSAVAAAAAVIVVRAHGPLRGVNVQLLDSIRAAESRNLEGALVSNDCLSMKTGVLYEISPRHTRMALHILDDSNQSGTAIVQLPLSEGGKSYKWKVKESSNGRYRIINEYSRMEIRVKDSSNKQGAFVLQYSPPNSDPNGNWCFRDAGSGYYFLEVEHSGLIMEIEHGGRHPGADVEQRIYNYERYQQFKFTELGREGGNGVTPGATPTIPTPVPTKAPIATNGGSASGTEDIGADDGPSTYYREPNQQFLIQEASPEIGLGGTCKTLDTGNRYNIISRETGFALRVENDSLTPGRSINELPVGNSRSDQWRLQTSANGYFRIVNERSRLELRVDGASPNARAGVKQFVVNSDESGNWCFDDIGEGYYKIVVQHSGQVLYLDGNGEEAEGQQRLYEGSSRYQWYVKDTKESAATGPSGSDCIRFDTSSVFRIVSRYSLKALHVNNDSKSSGAVIVQNSVGDDVSYQWRLREEDSGYYKVINENSQLAITVDGASNYAGAWAKQQPSSNIDSTNWCMQNLGNGYFNMLAQHSGLALEIAGVNKDDGTVIQQWRYYGGESQQWQFMTEAHTPRLSTLPPSTHPTPTPTWAPAPTGRHQFIMEDDLATLPPSTQPTPTPTTSIPTSTPTTSIPTSTPSISPVAATENQQWESTEEDQSVLANSPPSRHPSPPTWSPAETFVAPAGVDSTGSSSSIGQWEKPFWIPLIGAAAANLPDGRILLWAAAKKTMYGGGGRTFTATYNPSTNKVTNNRVEETNHDMFCPGTAVLDDHRILITGGQDSEKTTIYDPMDDTWKNGEDMVIPRGYHSMTVLSDGSVFALGGSWSGELAREKEGEVWRNGKWETNNVHITESLLTHDVQGVFRADNHMWLFLAPNGMVFHAGPAKYMHWIDMGNGEVIKESITRGDDEAMNGNAVMFDIGMIFTVGGARDYSSGAEALKSAYVININGGMNAVTVQRQGDMEKARTLGNSVVLPNGHVVVVGGMPTAVTFSDEDAVLAAEIWDPTTRKFRELASMKVPRTYHSTAILLKDGRVFAAGGGLCGECDVNHDDAEIFIPPYLVDSNGALKQRPRILSSPGRVDHGSTFAVNVDTSGSHTFSLMRLGAVTHSVNNDVRRIPLVITNQYGPTFQLRVPDNPATAVPGSYFLFAMNADGVPSDGEIMSISPKFSESIS